MGGGSVLRSFYRIYSFMYNIYRVYNQIIGYNQITERRVVFFVPKKH